MFVEMTYPDAVQTDVPGSGVALFPEGAVDLWRLRGWIPTAELTQSPDGSNESASDTQTPPNPADKKSAKPATRGESQE